MEENNDGDEIDGSIGPSAATARPTKENPLLSSTQNHKDRRNTPHATRRVCRFCFLEKESVVVSLLLILDFSLQSQWHADDAVGLVDATINISMIICLDDYDYDADADETIIILKIE